MINDSFRLRYKSIPAAISMESGFSNTLMHNHREIEILIIEKGSAYVTAGNDTFLCKSGSVVLINPMEVHSVEVVPDGEYFHKCVCFDAALICDKNYAEALEKEQLGFLNRVSEKDDAILFELAQKLYMAIDEQVCKMEVSAYASLIAAHMIKNNLIKNKQEDKSRFSAIAISYISEHFSEQITSKEAAAFMNFNQSYFCRQFKKCFGMSFSEYLNTFRITWSRELLIESIKSISDISYECGFVDPVYFSRCFKKYTGVLPSQYRKKSM